MVNETCLCTKCKSLLNCARHPPVGYHHLWLFSPRIRRTAMQSGWSFLIRGGTVLPVCLPDFYSSVSSFAFVSLCCCYLDRPVKTSVVNPWWPSPSLEHLSPLNFGSCTGLRLWRIASCCGGGYSVLRNGSKPSHPAVDVLRAAAATCGFGLMFFARLLSALLRRNFSSE